MPRFDDTRFTLFTRDLARRQRRPRAYPDAPPRPDALEILCASNVRAEGDKPSAPPLLEPRGR
jgi:hypothetical protein